MSKLARHYSLIEAQILLEELEKVKTPEDLIAVVFFLRRKLQELAKKDFEENYAN